MGEVINLFGKKPKAATVDLNGILLTKDIISRINDAMYKKMQRPYVGEFNPSEWAKWARASGIDENVISNVLKFRSK